MIKDRKYIDILLLIGSAIITLIVALALIRWLQPSLLGLSSDLVLVRSSKEVVPYYENIFRKEDLNSKEFILQDPIINVRARQFFPDIGSMGPNDLLGFRNRAVPNDADIIVIGDSHTYGNNVIMWENWPHILEANLPKNVSVYSMATGGWGGVQYFYAFAKSLALVPRIVIIAFYTGNDSLETFSMAYGSEKWSYFIIDKTLTKSDVPEIIFPTPPSDHWAVSFSDGGSTVFTPKLRHGSIQKHPAVDAGYKIMVNIASFISEKCKEENIKVIFTIIPTKEWVYFKKIKKEGIEMIPTYEALVVDESSRISNFSRELLSIDNAVYIDVASKLQNAALGPVALYPENVNGHPLKKGYRIIAETIQPFIKQYVRELDDGLAVVTTDRGGLIPIYVSNNQFWIFSNDYKVIEERVNISELPTYKTRTLTNMHYMGYIKLEDIDFLKEN